MPATTATNIDFAARMNKFVPVPLTADMSKMTPGDIEAMNKLKQVCILFDNLNMQQNWDGCLDMLKELEIKAEHGSQADKDLLAYFRLNKGPWDRTLDNEPFVEGAPKRPATANFYPKDMTAEEFQDWVKTLSPEQAKQANSFYTVIKRDANGNLYSVPYSVEYASILTKCSQLMKESADLVSEPTLAKFLRSRGEALLSNEYLESELDWLKISDKAPMDITCGPYETYTDALLAQKASFEMYLMIRDFASSEQLKVFSSLAQEFEYTLPVAKEFQNQGLDKPMPIVAVNEVYNGGDIASVMDAAYNLPNDEEAIEKGGSKLVLIKNVQRAKFDETLLPISKLVVREDQRQFVEFDSFWSHTLLHEISHSNGPSCSNMKQVFENKSVEPVTVRSALGDVYAALEEAKADIVGLYGLTTFMPKRGVYPDRPKVDYTTYLAGAFRSIRFGTEEAHGKGQLIQLNFLLDHGGFKTTPEGLFYVDWEKIPEAVTACCKEFLEIQATGDKARCDGLFEKYGKVEGVVAEALKKLESLPTDVRAVWTI